MKELTWQELLDLFDDTVHDALQKLRDSDGVDGLVVFENVNLSSSAIGKRTALAYGPDCTYHELDDVEGKYLNDLPSQRQEPRYYYRK